MPLAVTAAVVLAERRLRPDQRRAFDHAVAAGGLKLIEGRAGTGKSYTLAAIRDAHAQDRAAGDRAGADQRRGAGPEAAGFAEAGTVHAALFGLKNGRTDGTGAPS